MGTDVKRALVTGVSGQDGAYLSKLLLEHGYDVYGLVRRGTSPDGCLGWLGILDRVKLVRGDLADLARLIHLMREIRPHEVFNLAGQSFVPASWEQPVSTSMITGVGAVHALEAVRLGCPEARFYQASSSEMFAAHDPTQSELTAKAPRTPYAAAKEFAYWMTVSYRDGFGLHASNGILFNHESPLRRPEFVTRKVSTAVSRIKLGLMDELRLGNIDVKRDWGHSKDYVRAMWLMLQQSEPDDYVVATGRVATVRDVCEIAFDYVGLKAENHIVIDQNLYRPAEPAVRCGDASKAKKKLGWTPSVTLEQMICEMVDADIERTRQLV
jgi:GDPmannose 4,6-dehydratase